MALFDRAREALERHITPARILAVGEAVILRLLFSFYAPFSLRRLRRCIAYVIPRITTRRPMTAVAVVGIVVWAGMLWRTRSDRLRNAAMYAELEASDREAATISAGLIESTETIIRTDEFLHEPAARVWKRSLKREQADYASLVKSAARYAELRRRYLRAASRPWLPVPPEPSQLK